MLWTTDVGDARRFVLDTIVVRYTHNDVMKIADHYRECCPNITSLITMRTMEYGRRRLANGLQGLSF